MAWKQGPLPKDTWGWGGVVPAEDTSQGFYFADFCGDSVRLVGTGTGGDPDRVLKAHEVGQYDNSLTLPHGASGRASA